MDTFTRLKGLFSAEGRHDPYSFYAQLHRAGPACAVEPQQDRYALVVHGYRAVEQVMRDPTFRTLDQAYLDKRLGTLWRRRLSLRTLQSMIFFLNAPDHGRLRQPIAQAFTARRMANLRPTVIRLIEHRLDRLAELGRGGRPVDLVADYAYPLPIDVISELVGVPEEDRAWFPARSEPFSLVLEPGPNGWRYLAAGDAAARELTAYFHDLVAKRRAEPRVDLISTLLAARANGAAEFSDEELATNMIGIYNAGFLTSVHAIGNGIVLLAERPAMCARLRAEPDTAPAYVEEILRYKTPLQFGVRWVAADTEVAGVPVAAGSEVLVLFGAANRDPQRFTDPDVFDPTRPDNQPMSFSVGPHYCLGAALSRMEIQLALPMLLRRFPSLAMAGEPQALDLLTFHGYAKIPVTIE